MRRLMGRIREYWNCAFTYKTAASCGMPNWAVVVAVGRKIDKVKACFRWSDKSDKAIVVEPLLSLFAWSMISMKISALLVLTGAKLNVWLKTMRAPALLRSSGNSFDRGGFLAGFETWGAGPGGPS